MARYYYGAIVVCAAAQNHPRAVDVDVKPGQWLAGRTEDETGVTVALVLPNSLIYLLKRLSALRFVGVSPASRWGAAQLKKYQFLLESQWWSKDQLQSYQWQLLHNLLNHAYNNTDFYRKRFDSLGAHPRDIKSLDDFRKLPYVTKDDVRNSLTAMQARNCEQFQPVEIRTGGSTGAPLHMFKSRNAEHMRVAVSWRTLKFGGIDFDTRKVLINHSDAPAHRQWHVDFLRQLLLFYSAQTTDRTMSTLLQLSRKFKAESMIASIGFVRVLGEFAERENIRLRHLKAIFVIGEAVSQQERLMVEQRFGCRLYDAYGMRENAVSASECEYGGMHINSEFTLMEFENSGTAAPAGQSARIIGTNLHNFAVPLIRYNTEDLGQHREDGCPCGRGLPLMKIEGGRSRDFIKTKSGYVFVTWHLAQLIDKNMGVAKMQLHQTDISRVIVRIVKRDSFTESDESAIVARLRDLTRGEVELQVQYVADIPRTRLGKFRFVKSDLVETQSDT